MKQHWMLIKFKWFFRWKWGFCCAVVKQKVILWKSICWTCGWGKCLLFLFLFFTASATFLFSFNLFFTRFLQEKTHLQILQWCLIYSVLCCWLQAMGMSLNKHFWQFVLLSIIILWCWIGVVAMAIQCQFHILFNLINRAKHIVQIK